MLSKESMGNAPEELTVLVVSPEELVSLANEQLAVLINLGRQPEVIVTALEEFLIARNPDLTIIKTHDSIAMMVGTQLVTIYSAVLHS